MVRQSRDTRVCVWVCVHTSSLCGEQPIRHPMGYVLTPKTRRTNGLIGERSANIWAIFCFLALALHPPSPSPGPNLVPSVVVDGHYITATRTWLLSPQFLFFRPEILSHLGFPGGTSGKEPTCQCRRHKRYRFHPWIRKIPWRRAWHPTPVFLPGESHEWRSLLGYSPWGLKEADTSEAT